MNLKVEQQYGFWFFCFSFPILYIKYFPFKFLLLILMLKKSYVHKMVKFSRSWNITLPNSVKKETKYTQYVTTGNSKVGVNTTHKSKELNSILNQLTQFLTSL